MNQPARLRTLLLIVAMLYSLVSEAQSASSVERANNPITTAVPFLTITPDSRHGAMGDAGVATSADANSQHWNPSWKK